MALTGHDVPDEVDMTPYIEYRVCKEMGWTFDELERQPAFRVEQVIRFMDIEAAVEKDAWRGVGRRG